MLFAELLPGSRTLRICTSLCRAVCCLTGDPFYPDREGHKDISNVRALGIRRFQFEVVEVALAALLYYYPHFTQGPTSLEKIRGMGPDLS